MLSHVFLGTNDPAAAHAFHAPILERLGWRPRFADAAAGRFGWQPAAGPRPLFLLGRPHDRAPAAPGNGGTIALLAPDRPTVDTIFALALATGGRSEGAPGPRPHYHDSFYGAYFRDPDGNKICICCHAPPGDRHPAKPPLTRGQMLRHGEAWIAAWNRRDLEQILAGFADDATFRSPFAAGIAGTDLLIGKARIRACWQAALDRIGHLRFRLIDMVCDEATQTLAIQYEAELDAPPRRACEIVRFGPAGKQAGEALYGHAAPAAITAGGAVPPPPW
ncbi:MAG: nuclear transport factor 2 family protein [Amaricoccus sp.]